MKYIITFKDNSTMNIESDSHHYNEGTILVFFNERTSKRRKRFWTKTEHKIETIYFLNLNTVKLIQLDKTKK
jgi:hypothetical protein